MDRTTPDYIAELLNRNSYAVERAMMVIKFSTDDYRLGCYYHSWVNDGNKLTGYHLERARKIAHKYVSELSELAKLKAKPQLAIPDSKPVKRRKAKSNKGGSNAK